ncbi:G-protein coupled receptor Mth-like [Adelges cooleyi]|uniref:G-protein coupled receptor Mth-like n=1 Tax=Adelges cooleyi TaxID=133065 RepID=UPI00217F6FCA|nr:G-protein coupled receptor Mth-like [Adelges cooleyi]
MDAVRLCVLIAVSALAAAGVQREEHDADGPPCCKTAGSELSRASCLGAVAADGTMCRFHEIVPLNGQQARATGGCENSTAGPVLAVRKCCPPGQWYDATLTMCQPLRPSADDGTEWPSLVDALLRLDNGTAARVNETWSVGYNYGPPKCNDSEVAVDLSAMDRIADDGRLFAGRPDDPCVDFLKVTDRPPGKLVARACLPRKHHCRVNTCVRKCCQYNKRIANGTCKATADVPSFRPPIFRLDGNDLIPANGTVLALYRLACDERFKIDGPFAVLAEDGGGLLVVNNKRRTYSPDSYCVEYNAAGDLGFQLEAYVCYNGPRELGTEADVRGSSKYVLSSLGIVPSIVCMVITLLVYATLSTLRNVHGFYVMCYVACLLTSYVCLLISSWMTDHLDPVQCTVLGYVTLFAFLAAFGWLNVICFDIYWVLRYTNSVHRKTSISKRTIFYNLYSWGFALACTCFALTTQYYKDYIIPEEYSPDIGLDRCWFSNNYPNRGIVVFFLLPLTIMLLANVVLFLMTAIHCVRIKSELNKFKRSDTKTKKFQAEKEKFVMSIKLFLVMGISWIAEVLSRSFPQLNSIWEIMDSVNTLQGVLIFFIFVAKRKVLNDLKKKLHKTCDSSKDSTKVYTVSGSSQSGGSSVKTSFNNF